MLCYAWDFPKTTSFGSIQGDGIRVNQSVSIFAVHIVGNVMSLSAPSVCLPVSRAAGTIAPVSSRTWEDNV